MNLSVASWNIAAINNNPFEYWITYENEDYVQLMNEVQKFIQAPGEKDVAMEDVFTQDMYSQLEQRMEKQGWKDLDKVREHWELQFKDRKIISEFLTDKILGQKRLLSMPDRLTNTIMSVQTEGSKEKEVLYRPTGINCYPNDFASFDDFWTQWLTFMFDTPLTGPKKETVSDLTAANVAGTIQKIKRSKYPAITEEEEAVSIQLSMLCLALFDSVLIHMLDTVSPGKWQKIRRQLSINLNLNKNQQIINILKTTYQASGAFSTDVFFLQEVASSFKTLVNRDAVLNQRYEMFLPSLSPNSKRDQNSAILVDRSLFDIDSVKDLTATVLKQLSAAGDSKPAPVSEGDILFISIKGTQRLEGVNYYLASFHGDTNGLASVAVLHAIYDVYHQAKVGHEKQGESCRFLFGLDANTHYHSDGKKTQSLKQFFTVLGDLSLGSNYGEFDSGAELKNDYTTLNGRTFLQTQLNKAIRREEVLEKGDVNQKDFILFLKEELEGKGFAKDNTGERTFQEGMVFPTFDFPSDHAIISLQLVDKPKQQGTSNSHSEL